MTFGVTVAGASVLDLTNAIVLAPFGLTHAELTQPSSFWQHLNANGQLAPTQILGNAARQRADCDGLLVPGWLGTLLPPGTLPRLSNLVLFMDPAQPNHHRNANVALSIHDPTGLLP